MNPTGTIIGVNRSNAGTLLNIQPEHGDTFAVRVVELVVLAPFDLPRGVDCGKGVLVFPGDIAVCFADYILWTLVCTYNNSMTSVYRDVPLMRVYR
jgi:hypothetical protein